MTTKGEGFHGFMNYGVTAPCKFCMKPEKGVTCHIHCEDYQKYKSDHEKAKKKYRKKQDMDNNLAAFRGENIMKRKKNHRSK